MALRAGVPHQRACVCVALGSQAWKALRRGNHLAPVAINSNPLESLITPRNRASTLLLMGLGLARCVELERRATVCCELAKGPWMA